MVGKRLLILYSGVPDRYGDLADGNGTPALGGHRSPCVQAGQG
jgi:hypothetical protein